MRGISPDGRWIAYQSNDSGRFEIYVQPFGRAGERTAISSAGGVQPQWSDDGRELFYLAPDGRLVAVPILLSSNGATLSANTAVPLFAARVGSLQDIPLIFISRRPTASASCWTRSSKKLRRRSLLF